MKFREFKSTDDLEQEALSLLKKHIQMPLNVPHAVMLSGGRTPFGIYDYLAQDPVQADVNSHLLLADERHVPFSSEDSNYGRMTGMFEALGVRCLNINTALTLKEDADDYNSKLEAFINNDGSITLGLLGLGTDGHTASLFSMDMLNDTNRFAIEASPPDGPERISVTRELIEKCELLVFLVAGKEKRNIIKDIQNSPLEVIAGRAVEKAKNVELWYSK